MRIRRYRPVLRLSKLYAVSHVGCRYRMDVRLFYLRQMAEIKMCASKKHVRIFQVD